MKTKKQKIIDLMRDGRERTSDEVAARVGCTPNHASGTLKALVKSGDVATGPIKKTKTWFFKWVAAMPLSEKPKPAPVKKNPQPPFPTNEDEYAASMLWLAKKEKREPKMPQNGASLQGVFSEEAAERRDEMLDYIREYHPTSQELMARYDISRNTVDADLRFLRTRGVVAVGPRPARYAVQDRMAAE